MIFNEGELSLEGQDGGERLGSLLYSVLRNLVCWYLWISHIQIMLQIERLKVNLHSPLLLLVQFPRLLIYLIISEPLLLLPLALYRYRLLDLISVRYIFYFYLRSLISGSRVLQLYSKIASESL